LESNNTYSKEGKKKGKKKKRRRQKNNRTKKSLSRTHSFFFVFKKLYSHLFELSTPLPFIIPPPPRVLQRLLLLFSE
jgi:hypothetical protein